MRPAILFFAKAPVPGRVKTRLLDRLDPAAAARFHAACVSDLLEALTASPLGADVELYCDTSTDAWARFRVATRLQVPGDLGARMLAALEEALGRGRPRVLVLGSDVPDLPAAHLEELLGNDADAAFGPTEDGGYYAIACSRTDPRMFDGVEWSSGRELGQTIAACRRCGLSVAVGPEWYDIDTPDELARLGRSPGLRAHTRDWFLRHAPGLLQDPGGA